MWADVGYWCLQLLIGGVVGLVWVRVAADQIRQVAQLFLWDVYTFWSKVDAPVPHPRAPGAPPNGSLHPRAGRMDPRPHRRSGS